ncbi:hypothetical protein AACO21_00020 [Dechloromonas sp. ZS-1]
MNNGSSPLPILTLLTGAFEQLGAEVPAPKRAALADMITRAMGQPGRVFHAVHHALALADEQSPVITLAAFFHDLVYLKLDDGFPPDFRPIATRLFLPEEHGFRWLAHAASFHESLCAAVFDIQPDDLLRPERGLNEFSSALWAANALGGLLPPCILLSVLACIEASIPFRTREDRDLDQEEFLRLELVNTRFACALSERALRSAVAFARDFANRDVMGFAHPVPAFFLSDTLALVEENARVAIRQGSDLSQAYLKALVAMLCFLDGLAPSAVFRGKDCSVGQARNQYLMDNLRMGCLALRLLIIASVVWQTNPNTSMASVTQENLSPSMQELADLLRNVTTQSPSLQGLLSLAQSRMISLCENTAIARNQLARCFFDGELNAESYLLSALA